MTTLHVVFRSSNGRWEVYSSPVSIYADGQSLAQARDEFRAAAMFHFGDQWCDVELVEHVERLLAPGVYARTAVDRRRRTRQDGTRLLRAALTAPEQLAALEGDTRTLAATGDHVVVVCVPEDRLSWITAQITPHESLQVCTVAAGGLLWWTTLSGAHAAAAEDGLTLTDAGLGDSQATVADMVRSDRASIGGTTDLRGGLHHGRPLIAA